MADTHEPIGFSAARPSGELVKGLGLFDSTMIVVGSMIGSGIFIVSADIAHQVQSPGLLLVVWLASGLITLIGALSFGELAAAMPHAGGQYVYLRESCGEVFGFLYGWTMLLVIQTATIAAVAIAFAKFSGVLAPWFSASAWIWKIGTFGPVESVVRATWPIQRGPQSPKPARHSLHRPAHVDQYARPATGKDRAKHFYGREDDLTRRTGAAGCFLFDRNCPQRKFHWVLAECGMVHDASVSSRQFDMDDWDDHAGGRGDGGFAFRHGRVEQRDLYCRRGEESRAQSCRFRWRWEQRLLFCFIRWRTSHICAFLPLSGDPQGATAIARGIEFAAEGRVATAVASVIFGPTGAILMAVAILISTFGCNNGLILAGARIYYAMAKDGLFFRSVGTVNRNHVPAVALIAQCVWASVLCLSGTYGQLLDFLIFAQLLFYILTLGGSVHSALETSGDASPVSCIRLSDSAGALYRDGGISRNPIVAI